MTVEGIYSFVGGGSKPPPYNNSGKDITLLPWAFFCV